MFRQLSAMLDNDCKGEHERHNAVLCFRSRSVPAAAIFSGMKSPKKKPAAKLRNWRVAIMRSRAKAIGTVQAPDRAAAETEAIRLYGLNEDQRRRLLILERP